MIEQWGKFKAVGLALAMTGAAFVSPAMSADYDPPVFEQTEVTEVEFGTGWYIRGDLGMSPFAVEDSVLGDVGNPINVTLGLGYKAGENIRFEAASSVFQNFSSSSQADVNCADEFGTTGSCYSTFQGDQWAANMMVNAYYDLPTFLGLTPYVGAGAGIGYMSAATLAREQFCEGVADGDCVNRGSGTHTMSTDTYNGQGEFVGSVNGMAGVSYALSDNSSLDVGYRYTFLSGTQRYSDLPESNALGISELKIGMRVELW